jgi:hypothetical protein
MERGKFFMERLVCPTRQKPLKGEAGHAKSYTVRKTNMLKHRPPYFY